MSLMAFLKAEKSLESSKRESLPCDGALPRTYIRGLSNAHFSDRLMASPPSDPDIRHERFYFSDGSLYLLVEISLYRVHRSLFEIHASRFPACGLDTSGGESYFLKDVKKVDFDRLLACLYPCALFVEEAKSSEEWISILKLASKWGFESLQSRAMSKIEHTLASPIDMVVFGCQYNISDILLHGYATLCQGTTPLSSMEGRRLGVEDVINIYRIRHEIYGSVISPVSFEEAFEKARISLSNEEQEDEKDLEAERVDTDLDDQQNSEWTDAGSVAASPQSLEEEAVSLTADTHAGTDGSDGHAIGSLYTDPTSQTSPAEGDKEMVDSGNGNTNTSTGAERPEDRPGPVSEQESDANTVSLSSETPLDASPGAERPEAQEAPVSEQGQSDANTVSLPSETPLDAPPSADRSEAQEAPESEEELFDELSPGGSSIIDASSSIPTITPSDVQGPESSGSAGQVFRFLDELTTNNFDPVTKNILQWFKATPNTQILYQITQLIVERAAAEQPRQLDILVRLCKEMVAHLSGKVQIKVSKRKVTSGGLLFRDYLGDICRENLKGITASTVAAGEHAVGIRHLRLIEFIGKLTKLKSMDIWSLDIIDKWVTALLDANDEGKVATLCMLMTRAGPLWDKAFKKTKHRAHITGWFERTSNVAQRTSKPQVRTLLQDVIRRRNLGWVAK